MKPLEASTIIRSCLKRNDLRLDSSERGVCQIASLISFNFFKAHFAGFTILILLIVFANGSQPDSNIRNSCNKIYRNFHLSFEPEMKIRILEFADGAQNATGVTVIIDVFRAFSTACYAFDSGASAVITTCSAEAARDLRKKYRNAFLAGERNEKMIEGFDFGNSPTELIRADLTGSTVILTTTAGTNGLVNATGADIILAASLVNAGPTAKYIRSLKPEVVSLVAMGYRATHSAEEDLLCAELISDRLNGGEGNFEKKISDLRSSSGSRFFNSSNLEFSPPTDFFLCTMTDRFDFALRADRRTDGNINLTKVEI
jgi:2-phosphosulfolactate phosphatase